MFACWIKLWNPKWGKGFQCTWTHFISLMLSVAWWSHPKAALHSRLFPDRCSFVCPTDSPKMRWYMLKVKPRVCAWFPIEALKLLYDGGVMNAQIILASLASFSSLFRFCYLQLYCSGSLSMLSFVSFPATDGQLFSMKNLYNQTVCYLPSTEWHFYSRLLVNMMMHLAAKEPDISPGMWWGSK